VFDEEVETIQEVASHPNTIEMLNKGYKFYKYLTYKDPIYGWSGNCFGAIFIKHKDYEYKTVFLDGSSRTLEDVVRTKEVSNLLKQGYTINYGDDIIYDNYNYIAGEKTFRDYYAITLSKKSGVEYKSIILDGTLVKTKDLIKSDLVKGYLEQGYEIKEMIAHTYPSNEGNYFLITFSKDINYDYTWIIFDEEITSNGRYEIDKNELVHKKISEGYSIDSRRYNYYSSSSYNYYAVGLKKRITSDKEKIYQDEKAIGINGDVDGPNYPIYGLVYQNEELSDLRWDEEYREGESYGGGYYQDFNINSHSYFEDYLLTLQGMGYPITSVSTLSVKELNELTKEITGKEIPLEEWYENRNVIEDEYGWSEHAVLGNIKELYGKEYADKYSWIWGTSYWLKTVDPNEDIYDINTMGDLCLTDVCSSTPSRGLRPLVTIAAKDIVYKIDTKTDGNGTVKADYVEAQGGTVVKFTVTSKEGFKLKEVKVTDANGNVVVFKDYTFTMPNANVTIEAIFEPENPNTIDIILITFATLLISGTTLTYINYRKTKLR
jgi:hypothetical protein